MSDYDKEIAKIIDHTLLDKEAKEEEIMKVCNEAKKFGFASVCVFPEHITIVKEELKGTKTKPIAVIDFPEGKNNPDNKAKETKEAISRGAEEIDMVLDKEALHKKDYKKVYKGIQKVVEASKGRPVKVIIESAELNNDEKIAACSLAKAAGASFVKTSTGFGKGGATSDDVSLMRRIVGNDMGVKASGGIRSYEDAKKMIDAGASRIGASSSVAIVSKKTSDKSSY